MKSIVLSAVFIFISISIFISCKKEGGSSQPKEPLLSGASVNGMPSMKIFYNSDRQPTKVEVYNIDPANPGLLQYLVFEYNAEGKITEGRSYDMPGNIPVYKSVFEYDANGKLSKGYSYELQGFAPNSPVLTSTFTTNDKNLVIKVVDKDKDGQVIRQRNLSYFEEGHIKEHQLWQPNGGMLWLSDKVSYTSPGGSYPVALGQLRNILGGDLFAIIYSDVIVQLKYSAAGVVTNHKKELASNREYTEDGYLKRQTVTHNYVKPEADDEVMVMELEYIEK